MSDCGVCCYSDYEPCAIYEESVLTARKDHKCCECGERIPKGSEYELRDMLFDGEWHHYKTCMICVEIGQAFCCDGRVATLLWEMMNEIMGELKTSCFDRLKTTEAKAELQRRWMEWKGLEA